ncbi:hypothetical protein COMA1_80019 [Candidatus Nitrospira nitrosa]|uniref:Uncharacterized protein n=1 Tax=Candidatus Nitrospira nitrosa TaxID=1742972 RepID=A0A0S4LPD6_9BACT|nr:hypothetical protein COMA1_80019 [Candidatus Nitrospira nitrosa]
MINALSRPSIHAEPEQERQILAPSLSHYQVEPHKNQALIPSPAIQHPGSFSSAQRRNIHRSCTRLAVDTSQFI